MTLDIINARQGEEVVTPADFHFYREECVRFLERSPPSAALEEIFDLRNLYPIFFFLPFVFARGVGIDRELVREVGLACSLCARRVMIVDWCNDRQYAQLRFRGLSNFDESHLAYYVRHLDESFHDVTGQLFPPEHRFWSYYGELFRTYLQAMSDEQARNQSVRASRDPIATIRHHCLEKSILMRLCGVMIALLDDASGTARLAAYEELIDALILLLTTIDDASDYIDDVRTGQASELAVFLTGGSAVSQFDSEIAKGLIIKYYFGGGLDFVRSRIDEHFKLLLDLTAQYESAVPLIGWKMFLSNLRGACDDGLLFDEAARDRVGRLLATEVSAP